MKDYTKHINKKADIFTDNGDVVVIDGNKEVFRRPKNKQTISIAHDIYMAVRYKNCLVAESL
jgi:hypothetical protein